MKKLTILLAALFLVATASGLAVAASTYATSVVEYSSASAPPPQNGIFMNWDSTNGFRHNPVSEYPGAGADLDWLLGPVDQTVAAGWGGDANGGCLTLSYDTAFQADGTSAPDILVDGCGYAFNTPFTLEKGAIRVSTSGNGSDWTVVSDYAGYSGGGTWEANPDFSQTNPGLMATIMSIDLDDGISNPYSGLISFLKFELGDGVAGHGRAFFVNAVEGTNAVPIPGALWLLGSGLFGLIGIKKKKQNV